MRTPFSTNLRWLRVQAHLDQEQLALCIGVHQQTVSEWECGCSRPSYRNWQALRIVFGNTCLLDENMKQSNKRKCNKNFIKL